MSTLTVSPDPTMDAALDPADDPIVPADPEPTVDPVAASVDPDPLGWLSDGAVTEVYLWFITGIAAAAMVLRHLF